jgi:hypothetical protein
MSVRVNLPSQACARRSCQIARRDRPRKRRPAGIRRNTGRLYGGAISCRRRFSTDTILSASGNRRKRFGRRSKDLFWRRRQFSGRARASPLQNCPNRRPDSLELAPDFEMERRLCCRKPRRGPATGHSGRCTDRSSRSPRSPCAKTAIRRPRAPRHQVRSS